MFDGRQEGDKEYRTPANNPGIGDALRYLYNLSGKRLSPPEMDMDSIKTVHDIAAGGFAQYEIQYFNENRAVNGFSTVTKNAVSPLNTLGTGILTLKPKSSDNIVGQLQGPSLNWETRILSLYAQLQFDAAGALAFNNKGIDLTLNISPVVPALGVTGTTVSHTRLAFTIATAQTLYRIPLLYGLAQNGLAGVTDYVSFWPRWVPARQVLDIVIGVADGTSFPANTTIIFNGHAVCVPMGVQLPD
jgi:hypothetical protein